MALGPTPLNLDEVFNKIEKIIDEAIEKRNNGYYYSKSVLISTSLIPKYRLVQDKIERAYKNAGWKEVKFLSDQRDGDFLQLIGE